MKRIAYKRAYLVPTLLFACWAIAALGQTPALANNGPNVGVFKSTCDHVEPLPKVVQDFIVRTVEARKTGKPGPVPSQKGLAIYGKWQQDMLLQDFGGNCRYNAANAALPPATRHRIVFFGDSITELWGVEDPSFFRNDMINRGISGQTTAQMLVRYRQDVLDLNPHIVHILAGTNDIAGNTGPTSIARIEGNIMSMVEQAEARHIRVVLGSVLPAAVVPWRPGIHPIPEVSAINTWLKEYARKKHLTYIDYYSRLSDDKHAFKTGLTVDGVHPNNAGYIVMSQMATHALHLDH